MKVVPMKGSADSQSGDKPCPPMLLETITENGDKKPYLWYIKQNGNARGVSLAVARKPNGLEVSQAFAGNDHTTLFPYPEGYGEGSSVRIRNNIIVVFPEATMFCEEDIASIA